MPLPVDCAFKIPSLNDGTELDCRISFPRPAQHANENLVSGFAIFAHPYASLGGSYDDPIVQSVGNVLLRTGLVLCTFNFRGAAGSIGSTSWTGKPELADYVSVYTFMLHLIDRPEMLGTVLQTQQQPILILGGYSYGSLITAHLPDYEEVGAAHGNIQEGTSVFEIRLRAQEVAKAWAAYLATLSQRNRDALQPADTPISPNSKRDIMMGGYGSEEVNRRARRNSSRKSIEIDKLKHSIEKIKHKLSLKVANHGQNGDSSHVGSMDHFTFAVMPTVAYLLVSPLLQPVSGLTTMFSRLTFDRKDNISNHNPVKSMARNLTENATLAVYGSRDMFTLSSRLRKWSQELGAMPESLFKSEEISGAGHFWHEIGAHDALCTTIRTWVTALIDDNKNKQTPEDRTPDV